MSRLYWRNSRRFVRAFQAIIKKKRTVESVEEDEGITYERLRQRKRSKTHI